MKLSIKYLLILSAIALASQQVVLADEACCDGEDADTNAEAKVEEAIESSSTSEGDAGKECAADDNDCKPAVEETVVTEEEDPKCPTRPHIIKCAAKYLDTNNNDLLERSELDAAMGEVHWLARGLLKVIGSTDAIMKKCDADGKFELLYRGMKVKNVHIICNGCMHNIRISIFLMYSTHLYIIFHRRWCY